MDIGRISDTNQVPQTHSTKPVAEQENKNTTLAAENTDKFEHSTQGYTPAYTKQSAKASSDTTTNSATKAKPMTTLQMKNESMKGLVKELIGKQASGDTSLIESTSLADDIISKAYAAAEATSKDSDNYWGAEETAERIFTFAKTLAGDNNELFDTMKNAFLEGFGQAAKAMGGKDKMPQISHDTYSKVMDNFDSWENEINGTVE